MGRYIYPHLWPIPDSNTTNTKRSFTHNIEIYYRSALQIFPDTTLHARKYTIGKAMFYQIWHNND
jgi:hypothetical protein